MQSDTIDSKLLNSHPSVKEKTQPKIIHKIPFDNKSIEKINLSCIFHDPQHLLMLILPLLILNFDKSNRIQKDPGRRDKFYFHTSLWCLKRFYEGLKRVNNVDVKVFLVDNCTLPCECIVSACIDKDYDH